MQISRAQASHTDSHIADATPDTAAPTFFDGTYFSSSPDGTVTHNDAVDRPHLTEYSGPKWRYLYNTTMVILDLLMTIIATCIVFACNPGAYANLQNIGPADYGVLSFLSLACISWLISLYAARSYERHTMGEGYGLYAKLFNAVFIDFIMLCTLGYLFHLNVPRSLNVFIPILSLILVIVERWLMRRALHRNRAKGSSTTPPHYRVQRFLFGCGLEHFQHRQALLCYLEPVIIIGSPEGISKTLKQLKARLSLGYAPIAVCPVTSVCDSDDPNAAQHLVSVPFIPANDEEARLKVLALNSHLPQTAKRMKVRTILIADVLTHDSEIMRTLSLAVESMGIELALPVSVADLNGANLQLHNDPSMPILTARLAQYSLPTRIFKRVCDIDLSLVAIILSSPIMLWAAYKIKREDGGPVFYSQMRIGIYGKPFTMYKFRSMRINADKMDAEVAAAAGVELGATFKVKDDPRVTKIGKFIRKTSIDEIPQFFSVLKGDMSMVGPRPQRQYEVDQYSPLYSTRLLVKPGITGPWQISGRNDLSQEQSQYVDVSYIQNWSITGDIAILLKTVGAVFNGTGM